MIEVTGQITGVILAGGRNSRFKGEDKAFVHVEGVPMVERVMGRLGEIFTDIIAVTNSPERYSSFNNLLCTPDIYRGTGPLGGIHAAMKKSGTPFIFVVSCDMPYLDPGLIKRQIRHFMKSGDIDALIPRINSGFEPLHAIYRTRLAVDLEQFLDTSSDYSILLFLENKTVEWFDLQGTPREKKAFININRPSDIPGSDQPFTPGGK
jgi:molybdopterin-guanine dinucleotide biosynthesis protein A